jgi:uncharacterized NAD(P)/FAD-binding protein YdhS
MNNFCPTYDLAIIGAGFSGTMVAVHAAMRSHGKMKIQLIERHGEPGRGVAYGTTDHQHLLNVRAVQMGALADAPDDFYQWLQSHPKILEEAKVDELKPDSFMPRLVYGAYLQDILRHAISEHGGIEKIQTNIVDLVAAPEGYQLYNDKGPVAIAHSVVLALGNFPPGNASENTTVNPYAPEIHSRLSSSGDVFLIGTGLTSLDLLVTMARTKPRGTIHLVSRGRLFPQVHDNVQPYACFLDPSNLPKTALQLLHAVRCEIRKAAHDGIGWQSVIDSLRPLNQKIWQALPQAEQKKFLHRLRSYWDTHRHRCAAKVMQARDRLAADGRLVQHRGAFVSMEQTPTGVAVTWQPAESAVQKTINVACAVICTGPQSDCRKLDDPLIKNLLKRDMLAPDPLRMGAHTDEKGRLYNAKGEIVRGLYTIGTWRKGRLYESVAVPELRVQAADLAETIVDAWQNTTGGGKP